MTRRFPYILLAIIPFMLFVLPNWHGFIQFLEQSRLALVQAAVVFLAVPLIVGAAVLVSTKVRKARPDTDHA